MLRVMRPTNVQHIKQRICCRMNRLRVRLNSMSPAWSASETPLVMEFLSLWHMVTVCCGLIRSRSKWTARYWMWQVGRLVHNKPTVVRRKSRNYECHFIIINHQSLCKSLHNTGIMSMHLCYISYWLAAVLLYEIETSCRSSLYNLPGGGQLDSVKATS